jgi:NAD-dependent SIR2 family protein deacetylase
MRRCAGECEWVWCHCCGSVMQPSEWIERESRGGLNECPKCGDTWPSGMCLCEVIEGLGRSHPETFDRDFREAIESGCYS